MNEAPPDPRPPYQPRHDPATWPDVIRALPVRLHPDGRRLVDNAHLTLLYGVKASGVREKRRVGKVPPIAYTHGNHTYSDLAALADCYLDEFPEWAVTPPPGPPEPAPIPIGNRVAPVPDEPSEGASIGQGELRQADGIEAVRNLLAQLVALERESDGQVSKLTEALAAQARIMEMQTREMAEKDAEIRRLRAEAEVRAKPPEVATPPSETRHRSVWEWLTKRRG